MIERVYIAGIATFQPGASELDGLSKFNYFYGPNGSGKTTISRLIADESAFPGSSVTWKAGTRLEPLVYNRDFVERHFRQADALPGIFTLGEKNAETVDRIATAKVESDSIASDIVGLKRTLEGDDGNGGKLGELAIAGDAFKDACWKQKQVLESRSEVVKTAFEGYRKKKDRFKIKVLQERATNKAELKSLDYILERAATVFADGVARIDPLKGITPATLLECEQSQILAKKVIGKSDVDIAAMIERLGNSDWVRTGRQFFELNDDRCPFCQQDVASGFASSLNAYFDETFETDNKTISNLVSEYESQSNQIITILESLLATPPSQLDSTALAAKKKLLHARFEINLQRLREKQKEPSRAMELHSSKDLVSEIEGLIAQANSAIARHNSTVANLSMERVLLKDQVWKYLLEGPLKDAITTYETNKSAIDKAVANIGKQIQTKEHAKRETDDEIRRLEREVTSIQPTVDAINNLLRSFGFQGFSLAQADGKPCYKLVRADGTDAKETLSEGEKSFITFLYFYHLLKGSVSESGMTHDRVVVFDDPVSSLDSDILFIVSTLIRKLCDEVRSGSTSVKQVFLLTHNVYFHKEVTFRQTRGSGCLNEETFWTVRKSNGESQVSRHLSNPIKSSYELLWMEVREPNPRNLSVQNALRRILETYFKMLGGIDLDKILDPFEGNDKLACRALLSWVNDGSHSAHDDLYVAVCESTVELYLDVFRRIFEGANQIEHYNMMMAGPSNVALPKS